MFAQTLSFLSRFGSFFLVALLCCDYFPFHFQGTLSKHLVSSISQINSYLPTVEDVEVASACNDLVLRSTIRWICSSRGFLNSCSRLNLADIARRRCVNIRWVPSFGLLNSRFVLLQQLCRVRSTLSLCRLRWPFLAWCLLGARLIPFSCCLAIFSLALRDCLGGSLSLVKIFLRVVCAITSQLNGPRLLTRCCRLTHFFLILWISALHLIGSILLLLHKPVADDSSGRNLPVDR